MMVIENKINRFAENLSFNRIKQHELMQYSVINHSTSTKPYFIGLAFGGLTTFLISKQFLSTPFMFKQSKHMTSINLWTRSYQRCLSIFMSPMSMILTYRHHYQTAPVLT